MSANCEGLVVGVQPWLPWPLSQWKSWTEPVRSERLAALRIGVAFVCLADVLTTYVPDLHDFFGPDSIAQFGDRKVFSYYTQPPRWSWSVLRGLGQPANLLLITLGTFGLIWSTWADWDDRRTSTSVARKTRPWAKLLGCVLLASLMLLGFASRLLSGTEPIGEIDLAWIWGPWDANPAALEFFMMTLVIALVCLLFGFLTRLAAIVVWLLMNSFDNLNPYVGNQGDVVRAIMLFYLMLIPCGVAWSVDSWLRRRRTRDLRPRLVHPWPVRLLFLQLIIAYFFNGLYKVFGDNWREGASLYYVLASPTMTRVSFAQFHLPYWIMQGMSYFVLAWEIGFPVWVANRWTRIPALVAGVLFHVGIWATLELGFFCGYMLCMYLPLVPWERFCTDHLCEPGNK